MNRVCNGTIFFGLAPWGPGEGPKGQISLNIIKFQLQSQFQRFFNQTLCVFSHMKDIKHIRRDFHLVAWVMPRGSDLGVPWGGLGVNFFFSKFNQIWCVSYLHEWHMHRRHFLGPHPLGPWGGAKGSNTIKSELQSRFQRFLNQTRRDFHSAAWVKPRGGTWGYRWGLGVKNFFPKFNQILCVSYSHEWHMHRHNCLGPRPLGPWGGVKN